MLTHSRVGTVLKSIRDNDVRAEFMGYNVANYRIFVFCVSAFMAAAAGAMYAAWVGHRLLPRRRARVLDRGA